jgi:hypothetical protein
MLSKIATLVKQANGKEVAYSVRYGKTKITSRFCLGVAAPETSMY